MRITFVIAAWICIAFSGEWVVASESPKNTAQDDNASGIIEMDTTVAQKDTVSQIEKMPELKEFVKAVYPPDMVKNGVQGTVLLELLVNEAGGVDSVKVLKSLNPTLDSSAVNAAIKFKFTPAMAGGKPVAVLLQYEYRFTLEQAVDSIQKIANYEGELLERGTKKPIPDAMVVVTFTDSSADSTLPLPFSAYLKKIGSMSGQSLEGEKIVATTDSAGKFRFFSLPACSVQVSIIVPGYEAFKTSEFLSKKVATQAKYYVKRYSYSEYEIVVYGKSEEKEVSKRQLSVQEIQKIPGLGGDAVKVVQAMPGVARPSFGFGDVIVRGAPTWDSKFYLDGIEIPVLYHYGGLKSTYNSDALQGIDFMPGGFGTRYGGAIAGVIELNGKEGANDRWHGNFDLSTIDGSFLVEGPVNKNVSILASARRSFMGDIIHWYTKSHTDDFPMTISMYYWDYILRTDVHFSKNNHLFLTLFGSRDTMGILYPDMRYGDEDISDAQDKFGMNSMFNMGILGWDYTINSRWNNTFRYSLSKIYSAFSPFGLMKSKTDEIVNDFREQLTLKCNPRLNLNIGADVSLQDYTMDLAIHEGSGAIIRSKDDDWLFGVVGAYLNLEWKPIEKLQIIPGVRYDYYPELHYNGSIVPELWNYQKFDNDRGISGEPSVRLNCRYQLTKNQTLKAAIGNYSQTPQPIGQVIHKDWGDPSMPSTKATHYVVGHEWKITDLINTDIQFYFNKQWDIPEYVTGSELSSDGTATDLWNRGEGRMYGIELMLRHLKSEHFFGWIAYTLSRTERYSPSLKKWVLYDQDETNNLQVLGSWHLKKEWDLGFRLRYVTGKPTTPIDSVCYQEDKHAYVPMYGKTNSDRVDPFFQLDLRLDKKFVFDKWMYSFYIDFQNLSYFIYKSPEIETYSYDYKDKQTFGMPPMVGIGVKAEF